MTKSSKESSCLSFFYVRFTMMLYKYLEKLVAMTSYLEYAKNSCNNILFKGDTNMKHDSNYNSSKGSESAGKYISAIYRHLQILISARLEPYRIGSGQYIFLITIAQQEGISQKALSHELLIDKTTTAKAISKLEAEGYICRVTDPADNRYNLLYLTESGKAVMPKVKEVLDNLREQSRIGVDDKEYELMLTLLQKVLSNVSEQVRKGEKL